MKRNILSLLAGPFCILFLWQVIHSFGVVDAFLLPSPLQVVLNFASPNIMSVLKNDLPQTLIRTLGAFIIAVIIGIPMGLFLGIKEGAYRVMEFIIDFFRSTPATALFPLFLLLFGIADTSKIAVAAFGGLMIILFNTAYGVMQSRKARRNYVYLLGATKWEVFKWVVIWESLPQTFVGLRNAISLTLVVIVVTEMFIGTNLGLGRRIVDYQIIYDLPSMYATIIITGLLGYLLNASFSIFERRFIHWSGK